jgi:hypothetical protein
MQKANDQNVIELISRIQKADVSLKFKEALIQGVAMSVDPVMSAMHGNTIWR